MLECHFFAMADLETISMQPTLIEQTDAQDRL